MARLIVLGILILLAIYVIRRALLPKPPTQDHGKVAGKDADMVRCDVCGLHVPRSEALFQGNRVYCCPDHAKRGNP